MTLDQAMNLIRLEVERAMVKFPTWPTRVIDAGNVVAEEAGELSKACLQATYEKNKVVEGELQSEAMQTGAMAVRFLMSLERYDFSEGPQHVQKLT